MDVILTWRYNIRVKSCFLKSLPVVLSSKLMRVGVGYTLCICKQKTLQSCSGCRRASQNFFCSWKSGKLVCICSGPGYFLPPRFPGHEVEFAEEETLYSLTSTSPLQPLWERWIEGEEQRAAGGTTSSVMPSSNTLSLGQRREQINNHTLHVSEAAVILTVDFL